MGKLIRTAMGRQIDIDQLTLSNENTIAVGNMGVNARGDELGPGGKIVKTRDQIMKEYYALNTPVAADPIADPTPQPIQQPAVQMPRPQPAQQIVKPAEPVIQPDPIIHNPSSGMDEIDDGPAVQPEPKPEPVIVAEAKPEPQPAQPYIAPPKPPVQEYVPPPPPPIPQGVAKPFPAPVEEQKIRGSLANSVAKGATVTQTPMQNPNKAKGVQRF